jgi:peptidoglycan/LPS O-acetylase OafA/YrhL
VDARSNGARWLGIDLLRGVAAYGVVVIHSFGHAERSGSTERFVVFFLGFAVPYFLAASLSLTAGRFLRSGTRGFLRSRVRRLVGPYAAWSLIYLATRSALQAATGRWDDLGELFDAPLTLVFLGAASAQLYFIPLLMLGELEAVALFRLLGDRLRRPGVVIPGLLASVALVWTHPLRDSPLLRDRSLAPVLFVALNLLHYAVWVLPYVAGGFLLHLEPVRRSVDRIGPASGALLLAALAAVDLFFSLNPSIDGTFPPAAWELVLAFGLVVSGIALSRAISPSRWLQSLAACTFGIYLAHPLVIQSVERVLRRLTPTAHSPVRPPLMAASAGVVFVLTWALVAALLRVPVVARVLFGTPARASNDRTDG